MNQGFFFIMKFDFSFVGSVGRQMGKNIKNNKDKLEKPDFLFDFSVNYCDLAVDSTEESYSFIVKQQNPTHHQ